MKEFVAKNGVGKFRVESNGRVRLILGFPPSERVILIGQYQPRLGLIMLEKTRANYSKRSFTFAIHEDLYEQMPEIKTILISIKESRELFVTRRSHFDVFGVTDPNTPAGGQSYLYLEKEHWMPVDSLEEALVYHREHEEQTQHHKEV